MKPFHSRTKIVATMGPASTVPDVLYKMMNAGVDVCRLNFSHGDLATHEKTIKLINSLNQQHNYNVGILADLQGPKIRIGTVQPGGVNLVNGSKITITTNECVGTAEKVYLTYQEFPKDVTPGELILLDDGKLQLIVDSTNQVDEVVCTVKHGGLLTSRKGVNLPNTKVSLPSLTDEDKVNLDFALEHDVDWVALSFVRTADDINELCDIIKSKGKHARIIAKIEKPEAITNIDAIIQATDGIMVARGDLGVELPLEEVPALQKLIIAKCHAAAKPVIVATQMLESMITTPRPTRAEVNDVANSVLDGADAVMLSAETSVGDFPVIVIETMSKIVQNIEDNIYPYYVSRAMDKQSKHFLADALCDSAAFLAKETSAVGIVSMSMSGYTAFQISSYRPKAFTYVFTANKSLLKQLSLLWGVRTFFYDKYENTDDTIMEVNTMLKDQGLISSGEIVINTAAIPLPAKGTTNMLKITVV